jgi:hypothetical protein
MKSFWKDLLGLSIVLLLFLAIVLEFLWVLWGVPGLPHVVWAMYW